MFHSQDLKIYKKREADSEEIEETESNNDGKKRLRHLNLVNRF